MWMWVIQIKADYIPNEYATNLIDHVSPTCCYLIVRRSFQLIDVTDTAELDNWASRHDRGQRDHAPQCIEKGHHNALRTGNSS